jgi:hypothetical protein
VILKLDKFLKIQWFYHTKSKIVMIKKEKNISDKIVGFLLGLGAGVIVYAFLSLWEKPRCPVCKKDIEKKIQECPYCHSKLSWR